MMYTPKGTPAPRQMEKGMFEAMTPTERMRRDVDASEFSGERVDRICVKARSAVLVIVLTALAIGVCDIMAKKAEPLPTPEQVVSKVLNRVTAKSSHTSPSENP